jgi:hypothetical protein
MRPRRASFAWACTLIAAVAGCKNPAGVACDPPVVPACPDPRVAPSFVNDVYPNVFVPFCVTCHSPTGVESRTPLTTYQQIYGENGVEAGEIFTQVFEACLMPPSNAPAQLTDTEADGGDGDAQGARQTLLDWLSCDAPNN